MLRDHLESRRWVYDSLRIYWEKSIRGRTGRYYQCNCKFNARSFYLIVFSFHSSASQKFEENCSSDGQSFQNVGFTGQIANVRSLCRYVGDNPITGDVDITFNLGRGPAAEGQSEAVYQYWMAITRKNIAVIDKQTFPLQVTFPEGSDRVTVTKSVEDFVISRANDTTSGENFEIIVGFEVTPEQRAFNAEGRRFRVNAGQG